MLECVGWRYAEVARSSFGVTPDEPRRGDDPGPNPRIQARRRCLGRWCLCRTLRDLSASAEVANGPRVAGLRPCPG